MSLNIQKTNQNVLAARSYTVSTNISAHPSWQEVKLTNVRKVAIAIILILCNSLLFMSFGACVGGGFAIGKSLGVYEPTTAAWIAAAYPLTQGAFVLVAGRIGAIYGHKNILLFGGIWWILWSLVNGFCTQSLVSFAIARGFAGIGAAMTMPNIVAIIGVTFPPGRGKNLSLGFLGMGAPVAGTVGVLIISAFMKIAHWNWFFFLLAMVGVVLFTVLWLILPPEVAVDSNGNVDWIGAGLGISALILFNFAWNQAPAAGWSSLYIIIILIASLALFINFALWEHVYASSPIMPLHVFIAPSFFPLVLVILLTIMSYGICLWYMTAWQQIIRHVPVLSYAYGLTPHGIAGGLAAPVAAWLIPRVAAQWIVAFGASTTLLSAIVLATMPEQQNYWHQVFPAIILMSLCSDFTFTAAQIIATNSVKRSEQGIAGSFVCLLQLYGASIGLGFAGTIEVLVNKGDEDVVAGYRGALYLAIGFAVVALIINGIWVRVPKDVREGWQVEEDGAGNGSKDISGSIDGALKVQG